MYISDKYEINKTALIESSDLLIGSVAFAPKEVKVVFESSRASKQFTEPISPWSFSKINQTLKMFVKPLHDTYTYIYIGHRRPY